MNKRVIEFIRKKDFELIKELGQGACGVTVLLYDDIIQERFVCKKYSPFSEHYKEQLFKNFVQEIKLLYLVNHQNVVRVFNYHIYPERLTGYILMEYVEGYDIEDYLERYPENVNEVFWQTIDGFSYLEGNNILHRDIRPQNLLVTESGVVKIIDFGFGKQVLDKNDFNKSIALNWLCEPPLEFKEEIYNFCTEVYFVGRLFEKIITEQGIEQFKYRGALDSMCKLAPAERLQSFAEIKKGILGEKFHEIEFSKHEQEVYRTFSGALCSVVVKIEQGARYFDDAEMIQLEIEALYKRVMLEEYLPENPAISRCFIDGGYYFNRSREIPVSAIKAFIDLLKLCSKEKRSIILSNIHSKLDAIKRYDKDDIPF